MRHSLVFVAFLVFYCMGVHGKSITDISGRPYLEWAAALPAEEIILKAQQMATDNDQAQRDPFQTIAIIREIGRRGLFQGEKILHDFGDLPSRSIFSRAAKVALVELDMKKQNLKTPSNKAEYLFERVKRSTSTYEELILVQELGPDIVPDLVKKLDSPEKRIRETAIGGLENVKDPSLQDMIMKRMDKEGKKPKRGMYSSYEKVLSKLGDRKAFAYFNKKLKSPESDIRFSATFSVIELMNRSPYPVHSGYRGKSRRVSQGNLNQRGRQMNRNVITRDELRQALTPITSNPTENKAIVDLLKGVFPEDE